MRKLLIEKLSPDASEASKKLYQRLTGSEGLTDVTDAENEKGSNGEYYWDFIFKDDSHNVPTYFAVKDTNKKGIFQLYVRNDNFKLTKNIIDGLYDKQIIEFSDDLYEDGPEAAFKKWGFKGTVVAGSTKGNKLESLRESLGEEKYNKIQTLIRECLKEGYQVEITIPKK